MSRSLLAVFAEGLSEAFELDGRLLRTLGPLILRPGFLVRAFTQGFRRQYTSAVRLFVFALAVGFLALQLGSDRLIDQMSAQVGDKPVALVDDQLVIDFGVNRENDQNALTIRLDAEQRDRFAAQLRMLVGQPTRRAVRVLLGAYLDLMPVVVAVVLVPWLTVLLKVAFPRFLLLEHLLLSLHAHTLWLIGQVVAMPALVVGVHLVGQVLIVAMPVYLWLAMRRLFPKPWLERAVKFAAIGVGYALGGTIALAAAVMWALATL